jgi:predicted exporter
MHGARTAIALWIAGLAVCAWQVAHTRFVADLSLFLPPAPTPAQQLLVEQLRDGALSRLMLVGISGADAVERARLSRTVAEALSKDGRFAFVGNGTSGGFERERAWILDHRYALSPNVTPERFTAPGLRAAIDETLELLASPAGLLVKALVPRDPTGETLAVIEQLRPGSEPRRVEGVWSSPDGNRAVLLARTRASGADIDAQAAAMDAVQAAFDAAQPRAAKLEVTGPGVFAVRSRALVRHDVERLALVSLGLIVAILLVVYRSPLTLALGLIPVASGVLVGVAAVSLGFDAVHGITLGFGTTLIGEAVDYSIYLFVQTGDRPLIPPGGKRGLSPVWLYWPTVRLGVLTSIAGFSALLFAGLPGLAQLGVFSIAGLVAAAAVTRLVLPAQLPAQWRSRDLSHWGETLAAVAAPLARARWIPAIAALVSAAVLAMHWGSLWDRDLANLNPIGAADRKLDMELRAALGASDARHMIVVAGPDDEAVLASSERIGAALDALVADGRLGGYDSPARILPSLQAQRRRLAALPDGAELRTRLRAALAGAPLRAEKLEPFIADVDRARVSAPAKRSDVAGTALDAALDGMILRGGDGRARAIIGLKAPANGSLDAAAIQAAIGTAGSTDAFVLDLKGEVDRLYGGYFNRALAAAAMGLAVIVLLLSASLRSPGRVARVMAPLAAGVLVVAAGHALAGTMLTLLHLVGLLLVVAIGSNYALFFDRLAETHAPAAPRTLASLAIANLTTVASFGVLAASSIPVLHALGTTVAPGAFATLLFATMSMGARSR